jgi:RNA polymerase primary sigma factor
MIKELAIKYGLADVDIQEFYEIYPWNVRSFKNDDENNIKLLFQDIIKYPVLSAEEEKNLILRYQHGDNHAKELLILHMSGYVVAVAKTLNWLGMSFLDLISEWMLWLERAITMYDITKSNRLSTYAHGWIHNYMLCALWRFNGSLSLPPHTITEIKFIDNMEQKLFETYGRPPTQDEIAGAVSDANYLWRTILKSRVIDLLHLKQWTLNLWHCNEDSKDDLGSHLIDNTTLTPIEECQKKYMKSNILYIINNVPIKRDENIIKMRYGLDWPRYTLEQIWKSLWITRERIRQIEKRFIIKIQSSPQLIKFLSS